MFGYSSVSPPVVWSPTYLHLPLLFNYSWFHFHNYPPFLKTSPYMIINLLIDIYGKYSSKINTEMLKDSMYIWQRTHYACISESESPHSNVTPSSIHRPISSLHFNWQLCDTTFCKCAIILSSVDGHLGCVHFIWWQMARVSVLRYRILWEILSRVVYLIFCLFVCLHFIRILSSQPSSSCLDYMAIYPTQVHFSLIRRNSLPCKQSYFLKHFWFMRNIFPCIVASIFP